MTVPIGPPAPQWPAFPGYTYTTTQQVLADECSIVCAECGMQYSRRDTSVEKAEHACDVWLSAHKASKHET